MKSAFKNNCFIYFVPSDWIHLFQRRDWGRQSGNGRRAWTPSSSRKDFSAVLEEVLGSLGASLASLGSPGASLPFLCSDSKESDCSVGDLGSIPRLEDPLEKGLATCSSVLAMERGAWRATVHGVARSWTRLSNEHSFSRWPVGRTPWCQRDEVRQPSAGQNHVLPLRTHRL